MPRRIATSLVALLFLASIARTAHAWSNKEHMQLTRIAAERLLSRDDTPPAMKEWLRKGLGKPLTMDEERDYFLTYRVGLIVRGADGFAYWATMPDMHALTDQRDKTVEPFGVHERELHFIDIEFFQPDETKRSYTHDLSHKPKLEDFPRDIKDPRYARAGMLPFRVEDCYHKLVGEIRAGRFDDKPGQYPRDEHAVRWAGMLAHYAEDNTQPQHATIDYKSSAYFVNKVRAPNVHSQVEYEMCDGEREDFMDLRQEFWPLFVKALGEVKDDADPTDPWKATLQTSLSSYDALPLIGLAAMAATKEGGTPEHPQGAAQPFDTTVFFRYRGTFHGREMSVMEMKAVQQALAVKRVERLWLQAWNDAQRPAR